MMRRWRMGEGTRVAALCDGDGVHLFMGSGSSKMVVELALSAARALSTELSAQLPAGAPETNRPALRWVGRNGDRAVNWRALAARLHERRPTPDDLEEVSNLLSYLGVNQP